MSKGLEFLLASSLLVLSCKPKPLSYHIEDIKDPEEAEEWLQDNITYKPDLLIYSKEEFWAPCSMTYQIKAGDCEDYAICTAALLEGDIQKGYLVGLLRPRYIGHMIFAYQKDDRWNFFSDGSLYLTSSPNLSQLILDFDELTHDHFSGIYQPSYASFKEFVVWDYSRMDLLSGEDLNTKTKVISNGTIQSLRNHKKK